VARIAGVNIPTNKRVIIALQYIHGIGPKRPMKSWRKSESRTASVGVCFAADRSGSAADPRGHRPRLYGLRATCDAKSP